METDVSTTTTSRDPAPGQLQLVQDFVNTLDVETGTDDLADADALGAWFSQRELLEAGESLSGPDLDCARSFREALRTLLDGHADGPAREDALRVLNGVPSGVVLRVAFDESGAPRLEPASGDGVDRALARLLAIIDRAAADGSWARLKVCADDGCRWAFYDHSRNRSGSWCSMAVCGNRAKARSYRQRQRTSEG
jgi:predicted RNA-binding Zn ribbon-like protein